MSKKCTECEKNKFVLPYEYFANPLTVVEQGGDWIQGAIKNPGRCTPGSPNYDCPKGSPQWNLAQRFKHGDLHKAQEGGDQQKQIMQLIAMYAKIHNVDPQMIVQKLQELDENGQQQAIKTMVSEVQQGAGQMQQQQMQQPQQQEAAPMSYANNDESQEMESYADGGAYNYSQTGGRGAQGAAGGFGASGVDYIAPALQTAIGDSKMFAPLKAITGYMGLASGLGASALGYGKSAQWAGNKILPDGKFKTGFNNVMDGANNAFKGIVDFGMSGVTPFNKQMKQYGSAEYGGDLPKAQWGNLANIDMSDPYGLKKPRFGQTANYADTTGYQANANKNNTAATAPAKTMSPGNFNSWDIDNNGIPDTIQKAEGNPLMNNSKTEEAEQAPADKNSSFNGMEYAQKGITGLGTFNSYLDYKANQERRSEYEDMLERVGNTDFRLASNGPNPYGDYTLNVGPSNNFQLGMTTPIQDFGTKGPAAKYGGSMRQSYAEGGEYQVSEDELLQLMQEGAEIEFINK